MGERRMFRVFERVAIVVASFAIAIALIAIFSGGLLAGRDAAGVTGSANGLGQRFPDRGHAHLAPGQPRPRYDSNPPTSGAHVPVAVERQGALLSDDEILQALEVGDIVTLYGTQKPPPGLEALSQRVAGPFSPALAAAGQAVVVGRRPGTAGLIALAWTRRLQIRAANDPALLSFVQAYLGQGASH
jgi:Protein of unknown function (DUF3105)